MISLLGDDLELLIQLGKGNLQTGKVLPIKRKIYSGKSILFESIINQHTYIPIREKDLIKIGTKRHHSPKLVIKTSFTKTCHAYIGIDQ